MRDTAVKDTIRLLFVFVIALVKPISALAAESTELNERARIDNEVRHLFIAGKFDELKRLANEYRAAKTRTSSGLWYLTLFYGGFYRVASSSIQDEAYWQRILAKSTAWIDQYPNSPTPHLVHANMLLQYAWKFRGDGYASTVSKEAWQPFRDHVEEARQYLEKYKTIADADPYWYRLMADVAARKAGTKNGSSG